MAKAMERIARTLTCEIRGRGKPSGFPVREREAACWPVNSFAQP